MINSITNYGIFLIAKWFPNRELVKETDILITTLQTCQEKIYDSKTIGLSCDKVRLAMQGQTLVKFLELFATKAQYKRLNLLGQIYSKRIAA